MLPALPSLSVAPWRIRRRWRPGRFKQSGDGDAGSSRTSSWLEPFLSLSSSAEEDGGAGGYGRRDGGLEAWFLLNFFFGLGEEEEEEEKEEEDVDELVSWDDVVVSGCGLGSGGLGIPPPHVGCLSWFLGSGFFQGWFCWLLLALCSFLLSYTGP